MIGLIDGATFISNRILVNALVPQKPPHKDAVEGPWFMPYIQFTLPKKVQNEFGDLTRDASEHGTWQRPSGC
jgi:hypothetical protein